MKKISLFTLFAALLLVLGLNACTSDSPAKQFAAELNKYTALLEKANDIEAVQKIQEEMSSSDIDKIVEENADYQLTESDKEAIVDAMTKFITASVKKAAAFYGSVDESLVDDVVKTQTKAIKETFDKYTTLGQLAGATEEEVEEVEEVEDFGDADLDDVIESLTETED